MLPELGHLALVIALCMALAQTIYPLVGAQTGRRHWMAVARPAALGQFLFVLASFACLVAAFVQNDFSVVYAASNSNSALPLVYRISAVWGAHEGSLLLWGLVLASWTVAVAFFSRELPAVVVARVIGVMGFVSIGFLLFLLMTSNPFERIVPAPLDGRDLNPLLQDFGLIVHPPMLYMGYVGFSVPFAFAIAGLLGGRLDASWARWSRPWTNVAWLFLTLGIALGSWWAYYELGWGGWWFWDPVENASFMPWLVGTALIHSLAVTDKRGAFKIWTVLLAILAFSLSLLGTFLVRSGVLVSVHAFATDPARGVFILTFLCVVIGGSLLLYAWRAPTIRSAARFSGVSRESALLVNNILLLTVAGTVLLGTLYPLVLDAFGLGKISVGPPYFSSVFVPLMLPLIALVGFGAATRWKSDSVSRLVSALRVPLLASIVVGSALPWLLAGSASIMVTVASVLAVWLLLSSLHDPLRRWRSTKRVPRGVLGMACAHIGVGVFVIGVTYVSAYGIERDLRMERGSEVSIGDHTFRFDEVRRIEGPNYTADEGVFTVIEGGRTVATLHAQKRIYRMQGSPMTEAGIDPGLTRDLYVSLGEDLGGGAWSVRVYYKPFVRWIWVGALIMAFGGGLAASDRRYRILRREKAAAGAMGAALPAGK